MSTADYRKAFDASHDRASYLKACEAFNERHHGTALILWNQFKREMTPRGCVIDNTSQLIEFLKHLPSDHSFFPIIATTSEKVEQGFVVVMSDPVTKTLTITGPINVAIPTSV